MSESCSDGSRFAAAKQAHSDCRSTDRGHGVYWYAVFTVPQNEKAVVRHLSQRDVDTFLPSFEVVRQWKNRQRKNLVLPLFPCYLFVRISASERGRVLGSPGVLRIVGNSRGPLPVPDATIQFLRSDRGANRIEPFHEPVVGERVRVKSGAMRGVEGVLVRRKTSLRFVLSVDLINQHAAVEVNSEDLEPVGLSSNHPPQHANRFQLVGDAEQQRIPA